MGNIFPLVRDNAPILDRIRGDNEGASVAEGLGKVVGKLIKSDNDEEVERARKNFTEKFQNSLSEELGVEPEHISEDYVSEVLANISEVDEFDVLNDDIVDDLGLKESEEEEDEEGLF